MCISERLKQVFDAKNMRDPNVDALVKIHKGLEISITWLLTGNGAMFQTATQESTISAQEEKLIADYRAMPENLKDAFSISFKEISNKQ